LVFWDERLVFEGSSIIERRIRAVHTLSERAGRAYSALAGDREALEVAYRPAVHSREEPLGTGPGSASQAAIGEVMSGMLAGARAREIGQGITVVGPHRDDLELNLDGEPAGTFASRGQARCLALALKLAEAGFVHEATGRTPILALDDVLSELDQTRRHLVLEATADYEQVLLTTTDFELVESSFLDNAARYEVVKGNVEQLQA
jgi:DNA replication and repair protein RecF